jgi:hypothetical protein
MCIHINRSKKKHVYFFLGLQDCIGVTVSHPTWQRSRPNDVEGTLCSLIICITNIHIYPYTHACTYICIYIHK